MRIFKQLGFLTVVLGAAALAACGGGGDDSGPEPVTYSGNTSQATITESNAQPVSEQAFGSGGPAGSFAIASVTGGSDDGEGSALLGMATTLRAAIGNIDPATAALPTAAPVSESGTVSGSCGGTMSFSISGDDVTGQFAGSISFANFCEGDGTVNGSASFSGSFDQASGFGTFSLTFAHLTFSGGGESVTMTGSIAFSDMGGSERVSMTMDYRDNVTGKTFRVVSYTLVITDLGGEEQVSVSGRFYHHDYGYVDLSTPVPLMIRLFDEYPYAGQLLVEGANSAVRVTFMDTIPPSFTLEVDTDGDGTWDSQGTCNWDADCAIDPIAPPAPV
ncbi:MAG: hypothetical protein JSW10_05150 [Pseudomonadota bacterium]|nr:MAG: hypothetical protein JSW10_05150 [Pseudomonadota bacterium]